MLRISKLTDYGTVVLAALARQPGVRMSAAELAGLTGVSLPTVSKLLKSLAKAKIVAATRGAHGGYQLARSADEISAADIIDALEGPVSITECSSDDSQCNYEDVCNTGTAWQKINAAIRSALSDVSLSELSKNAQTPTNTMKFGGMPITIERTT
jgi:FeS assembly SUF system regulator